MKDEDVIRLATEAGLCCTSNGFIDWIDAGPCLHEMKLFAKLVVEKEREACAELIADWEKINWNIWDCAEAIRARGQA